MRRLCLALLPLVLVPHLALAQDNAFQKACGEHYALEAGRLSYLEAKLNLTDKQHAVWIKWSQWELQGAQQQREACLSALPKDHIRPTAIERENGKEKLLQIRLQTLQAAKPALQDLYASLTPEQREVMDEGDRDYKGRNRRD